MWRSGIKPLSETVKARRMRLASNVLRHTCKRSHELNARKWHETKRKTIKDVHRRSERFWSNMERFKENCQWPPEMEEPRCPRFQCKLEEPGLRTLPCNWVIMAALWNSAGHYIFALWFLTAALRSRCGHYIIILWFLSIFCLFFPRLISTVAEWMSTILRNMMWS